MMTKSNSKYALLRSLALAGALFLTGLVVSEAELGFSGALFILSALALTLIRTFGALFRRLGILQWSAAWAQRKIWLLIALLGVLLLSGALEGFGRAPLLGLIFSVLLLWLLVYAYGQFRWRYLEQHQLEAVDRRGYYLFGRWAVVIGLGIVLVAALFQENDLVASALLLLYSIGGLVLGIRWLVRQRKLLTELQTEQSKTELLHLQSQVNPHFFFNMLNNLYGLVAIDAKQAQALILKLSDMMRYSIYEGQREYVSLEEEVEYLQNYIELHRMRYHKTIEVDFSSSIEGERRQIMPLLLIILLENAFKHGIEKLRQGAYVKVQLLLQEGQLQFRVENNIDPSQATANSGIGLQNLRRRLALAYPGRHTLSCGGTADVYHAHLSLQL